MDGCETDQHRAGGATIGKIRMKRPAFDSSVLLGLLVRNLVGPTLITRVPVGVQEIRVALAGVMEPAGQSLECGDLSPISWPERLVAQAKPHPAV
jgi:hypothetical protein